MTSEQKGGVIKKYPKYPKFADTQHKILQTKRGDWVKKIPKSCGPHIWKPPTELKSHLNPGWQ